MALPVVSIDSATGSDSTASGAGPGTAISGSTGRTRNTASQLHFGFFGATDDFSGVSATGDAVCYMGISTAGARNFSSIALIKNTRETGSDAAITSGTAVLVVGSTSGWTAGDVIKVAGAGAASADLYSTILTVDSGIQATLNDNAGTTVAAAAWENPKQATLTASQGVNTGTTNTAWAIGGKRAAIGTTNSKKLCENNSGNGDLLAGWIVELKSGHAETITASINARGAGDTTNGTKVIRGESGAATKPVITSNVSGADAFIPRNAYWAWQDFTVTRSGSGNNAFACQTGPNLFLRMKITGAFSPAITLHSSCAVINSEITGCAVGLSADRNELILGNYIHDTTGDAIDISGAQYGTVILNNIIDTVTGIGIDIDQTRADSLGTVIIAGNSVYSCSADGIEYTGDSDSAANLLIANNILYLNTAYGIDLGTFTLNKLLAYETKIYNNGFFSNGTDKYNPTTLANVVSFNEVSGTGSPFTDAANGDFSLNNTGGLGAACRAAGFPTTPFPGGLTANYRDIGAAQHQDSGGSSGPVGRAVIVTNIGTY
jgi:hypothetical protein